MQLDQVIKPRKTVANSGEVGPQCNPGAKSTPIASIIPPPAWERVNYGENMLGLPDQPASGSRKGNLLS